MEAPSSFLNAFTLHPGSTTITESGRQSSSAPRLKMASMRRSAWSRVIIGSPLGLDEGAAGLLPFLTAAARMVLAARDDTPPSRSPVYTRSDTAILALACSPAQEAPMPEFSRRNLLGAAAAGGVL